MVASAEKNLQGWRTHLFCPKDFSSQLGKVLDRTRYPTGVCKGISVSLIGYMLPIQTRAFLCWFPDCLLLAAPTTYPTVTTELEGQWKVLAHPGATGC